MNQWVISDKSKALVHAIVGIRAGWRHETDRNRGITHFLEHALLLGNDEFSSPDVETGKCGVQLTGMTNPENTLFWFTSIREDFQEVFKLLLSLVFHPRFNEAKIENEKQTKIIPAVARETDFTAWDLANEWAMNLIFDWDFLLSLGTERSISSLTGQDLMLWHRRYYGSANSFVVVNGNVAEKEVARIVEETHVPASAEGPSPFQQHWNKKEVFVERREMKNTEVVYGFRLPQYDVGYEILDTLLGKYPFGKICGDRFSKLAFTTSSRLEWTSTGGALLIGFAANSRDSVDKINENLWQLVRDFNVDKGELETAKRARLLKILQEKEGGEQTLLNFVTHPSVFIHKNYEEILKEVKQVNKTQIITLATRCLNKKNVVRVLVGPSE